MMNGYKFNIVWYHHCLVLLTHIPKELFFQSPLPKWTSAFLLLSTNKFSILQNRAVWKCRERHMSFHKKWTEIYQIWGFPAGASSEKPTWQHRRHKRPGFDPWVWKLPWRRAWQSSPVLLPEESPGQRSLAGYSSWGNKEFDMIEGT